MARKEIHIDYHWFLILFSKALGAMIILFIIVPKLTGDVKSKLEKIEELDQLKIEVQQIDSLLTIIKSSVPEDVYKPLAEKTQRLQSNVQSLDAQVKSLQSSLAKVENQRVILQERSAKMSAEIQALEEKVRNNDKDKEAIIAQKNSLENQVEVLKKQMVDCDEMRKTLESKGSLEKELVKLQQETATQLQKIKDLEDQLAQSKSQSTNADASVKKKDDLIKDLQKQLAECQPIPKAGFELKDKSVVFVLDISGSMDDEPEPEKFNELRAGIKMMIANFDDTYKVDVVIYSKNIDEEYGYKYGKLVPVTDNVKYEIYNYLAGLKPAGCTPTKEVMEFVLKAPAYALAGTIVLLSDGIPTNRVSRNDCADKNEQELNQLVNDLTTLNAGKRVINVIGVGKDFRDRGTSQLKVRFMKDLAKRNEGFYVGF
ncbi:MAG: VWA domain-containing protein [Sphingobacteriales bacterium]|jgi:peptidoglycan hydrolase CwlO-like protein|nr:VWA domain-containing protein [Sphingobacteriales bacterium]MBK7527729.1 VWA domain-containing protein [Sphingobacteriales bacterium]MBP9140789.1 VWA domain-containing protein [Chitinophagales bacterium]MCC7055989.1 VWA domain-containing protein [Chitinophagales bacterium]MDA0199428.1 VWA domain-containing protein [Bacteroidota bacterium]